MSSPQSDDVRKVAELLGDERTAMFTTVAPDGTLTSRPMALQETEFDGDLWFFALRGTHPVTHVEANPKVNVTAGSRSSWVSLAGTATVVSDDARKKDLWNSGVEAWFPQGPEADDVVLLRVEGDSAEYWDTPGGAVASILSFAKAKTTGKPYSGGENEKVEL
jgi:general stress protein 26